MLIELAYRLITDPSEEIKTIRDNIIVLINPISEPDGWDNQVDWYYRYTKNRKEFDDGFPKSPPYWVPVRMQKRKQAGTEGLGNRARRGTNNVVQDVWPEPKIDEHNLRASGPWSPSRQLFCSSPEAIDCRSILPPWSVRGQTTLKASPR